jgi:hypothetical protein
MMPPPQAIFGGPLKGRSPLRFIYVDEAGIAANEPVTVVVGIIVDADRQWDRANAALRQIVDTVPSEIAPEFISHAKTIWGSPALRDKWPWDERVWFLSAVMSIPRSLGIPIVVSVVFRRFQVPKIAEKKSITLPQFHHYMAFGHCIGRADQYMRDYTPPNEVATVVAEDNTEMRRFLKNVVPFLRENTITIPEGMTNKEDNPRFRETRDCKVERIVDSIHFVGKKEAPLLQIADACAFGIRRCLAEQEMGRQFQLSIFGGDELWKNKLWQGEMSDAVFMWSKRRPSERLLPRLGRFLKNPMASFWR